MQFTKTILLTIGCMISVVLVGCEPTKLQEPENSTVPVATPMPMPLPVEQSSAETTPTPPRQVASTRPAQSPVAPGGRNVRAQSPIAPGGMSVKQEPEFDANLVANGSFEYLRDDGTPGGWIIVPNTIATITSDPVAHGQHALSIQSTRDTYGIVAVNSPVDESDLGKTLHVSAQGISASYWNMTMTVEAEQSGKRVVLSRKGWDDTLGTWKRLTLDFELPTDIDPTSVQVRFVIRNVDGFQFLLDDVRAFISG